MVVSAGDRLGRGWRNVRRGDPCEICGKGDWCSRSLDRCWVICRRVEAGGERRLDRAGVEYWLHALGAARLPAPALSELVTCKRACPRDLDRVYSALLGHLPLEASHREGLSARGLDTDFIEAGGYRSLTRQGRGRAVAEVKGLFGADLLLTVPGFFLHEGRSGPYLSLAGPPGLVIPVRDPEGRVVALKVRLDDPGDGPRYLYVSSTARGGAGPGAPVHVPVGTHSGLGVVRVTEGELKADVATQLSGVLTISVPGVSAWRGALPVLAGLSPRQVQLAFDADSATNPLVARAAEATAAAMADEGYEVILERWDGMLAKGVDDALVLGVAIRQAPLESSHPPAATAKGPEDSPDPSPSSYRSTAQGLVWIRQTRNGPVNVRLTNFEAHIVADVLADDGAEIRRRFEIEARLLGVPRRFSVGAEAFASLGWVMEHLGARALVYPGFGLRDHARAAMQILSADVPERQVFAHTGWRKLSEDWVYLHGGGALGALGAVSGVQVALPETLSCFTLPEPPPVEALAPAIRASLRMLDVAPDRVTVPVLAGLYRAALGGADFSLHLTGPTGAGKSELAALAQRHFGKDMDARHLPGSWASTANALEAIAFVAKDALLVVDDFAPGGEAKRTERAHADADRVLRAQGNRSGRLRMRSDTSLQVTRPPRGLILSTGEDLPKGQSLRGRLLVCELGPTDVDWALLTTCQDLAAAGTLSQALAGFLVWVAGHHDAVQAKLRAAALELRSLGADGRNHRRTPEIVANLGAALGLFLDFARWSGALSDSEQELAWSRAWVGLMEASNLQGQHQTGSEPAQRFLDLLGSVIASGRAHLSAPGGGRPPGEESWGWRAHDGRSEAKGERIGWVDGDQVYLDPDAAYAAVQRLGDEVGDRLNVTPQTLRKRLKEQGILASSDGPRRMLTIRRTLEGTRREVLHLPRAALSCLREDPAESGADPTEQGRWSANEDAPVGTWSAPATSKTGRLPAAIPPLVGLVGSSVRGRGVL